MADHKPKKFFQIDLFVLYDDHLGNNNNNKAIHPLIIFLLITPVVVRIFFCLCILLAPKEQSYRGS